MKLHRDGNKNAFLGEGATKGMLADNRHGLRITAKMLTAKQRLFAI